MHRALDRATMEATVLLLVAGGLLVGASLVDLGAGLALVGIALLAAGLLYAARTAMPQPGWVAGHDVSRYLRDGWIAPLIAAVVALAALGASPGEVQTLGGLLGLVGVANYFLRPLYHVGYVVATSVTDTRRPENG